MSPHSPPIIPPWPTILSPTCPAMSNLGAILNTESEHEVEWRLSSASGPATSPITPVSPAAEPPTPDMSSFAHTSSPVNRERYRYRVDAAGEHAQHPGCPDSLCCLQDTDERPLYTIPVLISCAILGSPDKKMLVSEIYQSIMDKYPYFTSSQLIETRFKQSLRHQLSLNRLFEREQGQRLLTRGFYWSVNLAAPPGTKRPRKRGGRKAGAEDGDEAPAPKRGRPPQAARPTMLDLSHGEQDELGNPDLRNH